MDEDEPAAFLAGLTSSPFRQLDAIGELCFILRFDTTSVLTEDDAFSTSLVCRAFYATVSASHPTIDKPRHAHHQRRFLTRRRAMVRSVSLLQWATKQCGLALTHRICKSAAQENQLDALKWALDEGCPMLACTCEAASAGGHLELLHWAYAHNAPLSAHCVTLALWAIGDEVRRIAAGVGGDLDIAWDVYKEKRRQRAAGTRVYEDIYAWLLGNTDYNAHYRDVYYGHDFYVGMRKVPWRDTFELRATCEGFPTDTFTMHSITTIKCDGRMRDAMLSAGFGWNLPPHRLRWEFEDEAGDTRLVSPADCPSTLRMDTQGDDAPTLRAFLIPFPDQPAED